MAPTPRKEAAAAAQAAVPTKGSINRQYGQSISDVEGFTTALAHLLQQGPSAQGAYQSAIQGQQGIDAAAQHALGATGTPYAAGSQAAAAGLGTSALSALNARGAAAGAYGATLPHVAAARGTLGVQSLETARNQALQQRSESYSQAFQQALQQARQNAEAMREFNVNTGIQKQQMSIQQRQFAAGQAYQYAALRQNQNQFQQSQAQAWQEHLMSLRASLQNGSAPGLARFTPNEIAGLQKRGNDYVQNTAVIHGLPIQTTIRNLMAQGIPRSIAVYEAQEGYATMTAPTQAEFGKGTVNKNGTSAYNGLGYQQALRAYHVALGSFRKWVNQRQYRRTISQQKGQGTNPGNQRTKEGRPS
jgi:Skp family chaperone for outer membrane proteins